MPEGRKPAQPAEARRKPARRRFVEENLSNTIFHNVNLSNARIRGAFLVNAEMSGIITGLKINGIEVEPLIRAEMLRRNPELEKMSLRTPEQALETWKIIERKWAATVRKAKKLPEEQLYLSVDEEWSFVDTLRHLVFATDGWFRRAVLREPDPFWPGGLTHSDLPWWFIEACKLDVRANPTLDEVLAVRADRLRSVRDYLKRVTAEELDSRCKSNPAKGYPADPKKQTVRQCLAILCNEEWSHRAFAERDLDLLKEHPELASTKRATTITPNRPPAKKSVKRTATAQ